MGKLNKKNISGFVYDEESRKQILDSYKSVKELYEKN